MKKKQQLVASIIFAMRLFTIQLVLSIGVATALLANNTEAQSILNKPITLQVDKTQILKVISILEDQTKIKFSYSANTIRAERSITYSGVNKKLVEFFEQVLKPLNIGYKIVNDQVVLFPIKKKAFKEGKEKIGFKDVNTSVSEEFTTPINKTITGTVLNEKGEPLQGASLRVKGSEFGTITNIDKKFKLVIKEIDKILVVSFTGYSTEEIVMGDQTILSIRLTTVSKKLEDVIVVGYGTQKKATVTGAISTIKGGIDMDIFTYTPE